MGVFTVFDATVASFATASSAIDLGQSHGQNYLIVPSMTSNSEVRLQASDTLSGTFRNVYHPAINSSTVAVNMYKIPSSVTNAIVEIPSGLRYLKVETTAVVSFSAAFRVICGGTY